MITVEPTRPTKSVLPCEQRGQHDCGDHDEVPIGTSSSRSPVVAQTSTSSTA